MLRQVMLCCVLLCAQAAFALDFGRMRADEVAVYVQDMQSGQVLVSHRADAAMNPASVMKLVTTFAALRTLGDDYRWLTQWKSAAPVSGHTLAGDIYWVGSGNPVLDQNDLLDMQQQLRDQGIRKISGRLMLDSSLWPDSGSAEGFDDDAGEAFATPPSPHMLAYKVVWAKPERNAAGEVVMALNPPLPDVAQENRLSTYAGAAACPSLKPYVAAQYAGGVLSFRGRLPESCLGQEMFVNMLDAPDFAARSFINHWRASGGEISDGAGVGRAPAQAATLAANQSKPLAAVLADMNKESNNVIARSVYLALGAQAAHGRNGTQNAEAAVRHALRSAGLDDETLVLENGSGLSRRERVSARFLGEMLAAARRSPFQTAFTDSLPIAGNDGTLKKRFQTIGSPLRLKTGTLKNVRALAGYWLPETPQHPLAIVVLVNSEQSGAYLPDLDRLVMQLLPAGAEANHQPDSP